MEIQNQKSILIVAAEASAAGYAENLIVDLKKQYRDYAFFGIGSKKMQSMGFEPVALAEDMAVMGFVEIIKHYPRLKGILNQVVAEAAKRKPDVVILIDYPDFNLRLAPLLHKLGLKIVYYVSPQMWAWRESRVEIIKKYVSEMLVLFPFEEDFYKKHNVPVRFVGHPIMDDLKPELLTEDFRHFYRTRFGIQDKDFVLGIMPGSRRGEIEQLFDLMLEVAEKLALKYRNVRVCLLVAPTIDKSWLQSQIKSNSLSLVVVQDDPYKMIALADMMCVASGTATLMVGLMKKPMVIVYRVKKLTALIVRFLVKGISMYGLVNLILKKEAAPELLQEKANFEELFAALEKLIVSEDERNRQIVELAKVQELLGSPGVTSRVVESLTKYLRA